jgi:leader peptidase (prepilin peptidase)/N-methyltransferase
MALTLVETTLLLTAAVFDLRYQRIPDWLSYGGLLLALLAALSRGLLPLFSALTGALVALLLLGGAYRLGKLWPGVAGGQSALGLGDVKLAVFVGALVGWPQVLPTLFLGVLAGGVVALGILAVHLARGRYRTGSTMPYGPALVVGGLVGLWLGPTLVGFWQTITA